MGLGAFGGCPARWVDVLLCACHLANLIPGLRHAVAGLDQNARGSAHVSERGTLPASVPEKTGRPWSPNQVPTADAGAGTRSPHTAPATRRWCRKACRRIAAAPAAPRPPPATSRPVGPAPSRAADHPPVGPNLDLDQGRLDRRVGFPATRTSARSGRRTALPDAFFQSGTRRAAVAGSTTPLAARAADARPLRCSLLRPRNAFDSTARVARGFSSSASCVPIRRRGGLHRPPQQGVLVLQPAESCMSRSLLSSPAAGRSRSRPNS